MLAPVFKSRRSCRTFAQRDFTPKDKNMIQELIESRDKNQGPFGHSFHFQMVPVSFELNDVKTTVGTYGFIKNPQYFLFSTCPNKKEALIDYGEELEQIVLELEKHSIGTVWLGGSFERSKLQTQVPSNELIPAVIAIGYPAEQRFVERTIRFVSKGDKRLPFDELFSTLDQSNLTHENPFNDLLEAVRLAPSASNKQPWRAIVKPKVIEVYYQETKNYIGNKSYIMQHLDMGIALAHLMVQAQFMGISLKIKQEVHNEEEYICTIQLID